MSEEKKRSAIEVRIGDTVLDGSMLVPEMDRAKIKKAFDLRLGDWVFDGTMLVSSLEEEDFLAVVAGDLVIVEIDEPHAKDAGRWSTVLDKAGNRRAVTIADKLTVEELCAGFCQAIKGLREANLLR